MVERVSRHTIIGNDMHSRIIGISSYSPLVLPFISRTDRYDRELVQGATPLDNEIPFDLSYPQDRAAYQTRAITRADMRDRAQDGRLTLQLVVGQQALRQLMTPATMPLGQRVAIQTKALDALGLDAQAGNVGILPYTADARGATNPFNIIEYDNGQPSDLVDFTRIGGLVVARQTGESGTSDDRSKEVDRARLAMDYLWEQSITEPDAVVRALHGVSTELRQLQEL